MARQCTTFPRRVPSDDLNSPGFQTIYADDSLLVLNKPHGLLSVPGRGEDKQDCLSRRVQQQHPDALVVHRLDMATSGLMLMARGPAMQRALGKLFEARAIQKRYVAVVDGHLNHSPDWQLIDLPIALDWPNRPLRIIDTDNGQPSQTRWRALLFDERTNSTRVELEPLSGRSHQLRVHLQAVGHPILGDALYAPPEAQAKAPCLLLHACALAFRHPANTLSQQVNELLHFESAPAF